MLVKAVPKWLKAKLVRSGELGSTEANTSGPVPEEPAPDKVRIARKLDMEYLKKQAVYEVFTRSDQHPKRLKSQAVDRYRSGGRTQIKEIRPNLTSDHDL